MRIRHGMGMVFIGVLLCLCGVMIGCTADTPALQDIVNLQNQQPQVQPEPSAQPTELIISHSQGQDTPEDIAAKAMQTKLQEQLDDTVRVSVYADYQLGSAREQLEAVQLGRIHITIQSVSEVSQMVTDLGVFTLPYLFSDNSEEVIALLNGSVGQEALAHINNEVTQPFTGLGLWFGGYKLFTFHGDDHKTIHSPADFCGLTIAVPDTAIIKAQYQHWGARTMPADTIQWYSLLEQRMADGTEATAQQLVTNRLHEVQRNVVQAYHSPELYAVLANGAWYSTLDPEVQQAIAEAEAYAKEILYQSMQQQTPDYYNTIAQTEHMQYTVLTEAQIAFFRQSAVPLYQTQLAGNPWMMEYAEKIRG